MDTREAKWTEEKSEKETETPRGRPGAMLVVCVRGQEIQQYKIEEKVSLGGRQSGAELLIETPGSQAFAGEIRKEKEDYLYRDMMKTGSVFYNGEAFGGEATDGEDTVVLKEGDVISFRGASGMDAPEFLLIFHRVYRPEVIWKSVELSGSRKSFFISRHEEMAGGAEVQPEDLAELPKRYAKLSLEEGRWQLADHNTRLGVFLNNRQIQGKRPMGEMDVARIGNTLFLIKEGKLYYNHKEISRNSLVIHIEERSVWNLFRKKVLLEDIDLTIYPGELILILGGSGAGKTTFINAVMGYEKAKGEILSGEINVYKNYNMMKYEIGFVPQQDLLRLEDGVYDTLDNAASLKLPRNTAPKEREERIRQVMNLFGLERESETLVGKLSGGQRKRLSIAVEYIADPSLFFLDEPDSGLDGVMARSLMENLRGIAGEQKIVLVITHSPDRVADLFDKVIVLAKSSEDNAGHLAFFGGIDEAKAFFDTDSLEGIVKKINREDEGGQGQADFFIRKFEAVNLPAR